METGRWVLQAAPTGFSAVINPNGDVIERTSISETRILQATIERRNGRTLATVAGPLPMLFIAGIALVGANAVSRKKH